jgi:hypothetical protein
MTKDQAFTAARAVWDRLHLKAYKCPCCRGWHLARHKVKRIEALFALLERAA